jgi:hypothetical protein
MGHFHRASKVQAKMCTQSQNSSSTSKNKMSAGADERLEGFKMGETKKWWCERDGVAKGQKGRVTSGKRQGGQYLNFLAQVSNWRKKTLEKCSPRDSA